MSKITRFLFLSVISLMVIINLVSCGEPTPEPTKPKHTCDFNGKYFYTEEEHWNVCICGRKGNVGVHIYGEWEVILEPGETNMGISKASCLYCDYEYEVFVKGPDHTHNYSESYSKDLQYHWNECSCGDVQNKQGHTFSEWKILVNPTVDSTGIMEQNCSICNYINRVEIPKLNHEHDYISVVVNSNCIEEGYTKYICDCGNEYDDNFTNPLGHKYDNGICIRCGEEEGTEGIIYELNQDGLSYEVVGYESQEKEVEIPNVYKGLKVTSIGNRAFAEKTNIISVVIPESVTNIEYDIFAGCASLTSIKVDEKNPVYDSRNNCNAIILTATNELIVGCQTTIIPSSVTSIGNGSFKDCIGLTNIEIPSSVTSIGASSFSNCIGLISIEIPSTVTSIVSNVFSGCASLTSIKVDEKNPVYDSRNNCNAIILTATNELMVGCQATIIPSSVEIVGYSAFFKCTNLTSIFIPASVNIVDRDAFYKCENLTSIKVDINNEVYDSRDNCNAIINTSTNELVIGCQTTTIPTSVTSIGRYAFYHCVNLTNITIPSSVTNIGSRAFYGCTNLAKVDIPSSITKINQYLFFGCENLTTIVIPDSVTSIGACAFYKCSNLTSVIIPTSVTKIDYNVFLECSKLTSIYYQGTSNDWKGITFDSIADEDLASITIYYYSETKPVEIGDYWHFVDGEPVVW